MKQQLQHFYIDLIQFELFLNRAASTWAGVIFFTSGRHPQLSYVRNSLAAKGGDPKLSDIVFFSVDYLSLGAK